MGMYPGGNVIKITPTIVADDNADNDVAFNWVELKSASISKGIATKLQSISMYDADDSASGLEFVFCRGSFTGGVTSAPTTAQNLQDGAAGSAVVDMDGDEGQAIQVCASVLVAKSSAKGDLVSSYIITSSDLNLIMQPNPDSTSLFVAAIWRDDPDSTGGTDTLDCYFGFENLS